MPAAVLLVVTTFRASTADPLPEAPSEIKIQPVGGAGGREEMAIEHDACEGRTARTQT